MNLGTKINIILFATIGAVLSGAFWVIFNVESATIKNQIVSDANISTDILHSNIERMFVQLEEASERLQEKVDKLSATDGVKYINITDTNGQYAAATDHALVGTRAPADVLEKIRRVITTGESLDIQTPQGSVYEIERYFPIYVKDGDKKSPVIDVVEVEVAVRSGSSGDIANAKKLLSLISASVAQDIRSIILTRNENLEAMKYISNEIERYGFFHDFIIFDNKANIIANTGDELGEFDNDSPEYKHSREAVLSGEINESTYGRIHETEKIIVRIMPIVATLANGQTKLIGATEAHILMAAYEKKVTAMKVRLIEIAIGVMGVLLFVLAVILRFTVMRPIKKFSLVAERVSMGDLNQTIQYKSHDEIGRFADVFNTMLSNLREFDQMKSDFLSVVAHQLRTPLAGVKWVLKLIIEEDLGPLTDEQRSMLKRGYDTNEKMIQLVNDLLNVSRIENGKFKYTFAEDDIMRIIQILTQNSDPIAKEHGLDVHLVAAHPIRPFRFDAEKILLSLQNLVDNAIKYTLPGGHITISVEQKGDYVEIKIKDTGVGIPKESISKLFSKFFRAPNVIYLQTEGSGLGLFIVRNIIIQHGGKILAESEEGKGTTFTVILPLLEELLPKEEKVPFLDNNAKKMGNEVKKEKEEKGERTVA